MSERNPYDPEDPSVPPSGVPDPTVHGQNPPSQYPADEPTGYNTVDDFRDARSQDPFPVQRQTHTQPARRDSGAWVWGLFLIALGVIFLLENTGIFRMDNWWALFIMLPAIGSFRSAYEVYKSSGNRLTGAARGPLLGGVILTTISMIFLFGLDFGAMWPLLLVRAGAALLVTALLPG